MSTKTVPTVYQSSKTVKNRPKTVKAAKMTIGVPIVTCLPRYGRPIVEFNVPLDTFFGDDITGHMTQPTVS